jgi:hypothetical protein
MIKSQQVKRTLGDGRLRRRNRTSSSLKENDELGWWTSSFGGNGAECGDEGGGGSGGRRLKNEDDEFEDIKAPMPTTEAYLLIISISPEFMGGPLIAPLDSETGVIT